MNRIKVVCLAQSSAGFLRSKLGKILTVLILVAAAAAASATTSLSGVSCGSAAYSAAATDPCSVYLMAKTNKKFYVTLSSNNPAVTVPSAVMVKPGSLSTGFNAVVAGVTTAQTATVMAQAGGVVKTFSITLSPATTGNPALSFSATSLAFGNVSLGTAISKSITVTSSGTAAVTINSDSISGTGFSVSGGSFPAVLSPGQAIVLSVQFNPSTAGSVTGQLTIASNASTTYVSLSGAGIVVAPTVSALSCSGNAFTGSGTANCTVSLSSTAPSGGQPVTLGSNDSAVTVPGSVTVAPAATTATFTATVAGVSTTQTAIITASANSSSRSYTIQLNAAAAALIINATSIGFGGVMVNTPVAQPLTITSTGTAAVTVNSAALSGTGFSVSGATFPVTLSPGQSLTLEVQFDPTTTGTFGGQLTIASSASTQTVLLSGTGESYQVALDWTSPSGSTDPIVGYNVYRAPGGTSSYQRVNASPATEAAYTDGSVQRGATYAYFVTSVDSNGNESIPSNMTRITIP